VKQDIAMVGTAIATLPGDQSGIRIASHDDYCTGENRWRDAAGDPISAEQGAADSHGENGSVLLALKVTDC